jgi:hypothetical protein
MCGILARTERAELLVTQLLQLLHTVEGLEKPLHLSEFVALQKGLQVLLVETTPTLFIIFVLVDILKDVFKEFRVNEMRIVGAVEKISRGVKLLLRIEKGFVLPRRA